MGDGGLVTGIDIAASGAASGAVCRTDELAAYSWNGASWDSLFTRASLNISDSPYVVAPNSGVWEIRGAPSNFDYLYAVFGTATAPTASQYSVYTSINRGVNWTDTGLQFSTKYAGRGPFYAYLGNEDLGNAVPYKNCQQKIVIDPANPLVAYVAMPFSVRMVGTYAASNPGLFRTLDGGATWTLVTALPLPTDYTGAAGICIDAQSGTTTLSGVTVTNRLIIPVSGQGVFESLDGGATFSSISSDPTPSTTATYTTSQANSLIVVQVACIQYGYVESVTNDAGDPSGSLTWNLRCFAPPLSGQMAWYTYYAIAPTAGTYHITVNYTDGNVSYVVPTTPATTATGGAVNGAAQVSYAPQGSTFTVSGTVTGAFSVGQQLLANGYGGLIMADPVTGTLPYGSLTGTGGAGTYQLNYWNVLNKSGTASAYETVASQICVFAVANVNTTTPFDSAGPLGAPTTGLTSITTTAAHSLVYMFTQYTGTADSGYSVLGTPNTDLEGTGSSHSVYSNLWGEISTASVTPGAHSTFSASGKSWMQVIDAIVDGGSNTIALDGTPVYARSGPAMGLGPVTVSSGQLDYNGNYWCMCNCRTAFTIGTNVTTPQSMWRNMANGSHVSTRVWDRIDGSWAGAVNPIPYQTTGQAITVDPRAAGSGYGPGYVVSGNYIGAITTNGTAAMSSLTWKGTSGATGTVSISSSIGWCNTGSVNSIPYATNMVIDASNGYYWQSGGHGVFKITSLNYDPVHYSMVAENISMGIEEAATISFLAPPGSPNQLIGVTDQEIMFSVLPAYSAALVYGRVADAHGWSIDYASDNPAFIVGYVWGGIGGAASGYSTNYGAPGSWHPFNKQPGTSGLGGGVVAVSSVGSDGLSSSNGTANIVCYPYDGSTTVLHTKTNGVGASVGAAWTACGNLPSRVYHSFGYWVPDHFIAADRVLANTFYVYVPGTDTLTGVWQSTDGGDTFTQGQNLNAGGGAAYTLLSVPGNAGHILLSGGLGTALYYSINGGVNMHLISEVTLCGVVAVGKAIAPSTYPTIFIIGTIGGVHGIYMGTGSISGSEPSPVASFRWTMIAPVVLITYVGNYTTVGKGGQNFHAVSGLWADENVAGRCYLGLGYGGMIYYDL